MSHSNPLLASPSFLIQSFAGFQHQLRTNFARAQLQLQVRQQRSDQIRILHQECQHQSSALRALRLYVALHIDNVMTKMHTLVGKHQTQKDALLHAGLHLDACLATLRAIPLHPQLQLSPRQTLYDCINESDLRSQAARAHQDMITNDASVHAAQSHIASSLSLPTLAVDDSVLALGEREALGVPLSDGGVDGVCDGVGDADGVCDKVGVTDGVAECEAEGVGVGEAEGVADGLTADPIDSVTMMGSERVTFLGNGTGGAAVGSASA